MNASNDHPAAKGLPGGGDLPRARMQRLIVPYEFRHLRLFGAGRIAGGSCRGHRGRRVPPYGVYGWAAFFLVLGALNLGGGYWYLTVARSASARS